MRPALGRELQAARDMGINRLSGELKGRNGKDLPSFGGAPTPILPERAVRRTLGVLQAPMQVRNVRINATSAPSSICTEGNLAVTVNDVQRMRKYLSNNIRNLFTTDTNLARNQDRQPDGLIELRNPDKLNIRFMIQMHILCHRTPSLSRGQIGLGSSGFSLALSTSVRQTSGETKSPNIEMWCLLET
jgi:hypothetical protein